MIKGTHHKKESIEKNRNSHVGKVASLETKIKMSLVRNGKKCPWVKGCPKGYRHDEKARIKISEAVQRAYSEGRLTPWNKGREIPYKSRPWMIGRTTWNKGNKGFLAGEKHYNWRGGVTPIHDKIRRSIEYKLWRTAVFERDNYTCIWGGKDHKGNLNADHIKPFSLYPELRFAIDNGRTLCEACHLDVTREQARQGVFTNSLATRFKKVMV